MGSPLHLKTEVSSSPPIPSPAPHKTSRRLRTSEPCPTPQRSPGPIAPMLHRSRIRCTLRTRQTSLEILSPRYYMVGRCICQFSAVSIYHSRDCHRSICPKYGHIVQLRGSHEEQRHEVGARGPHRCHVLACDGFHRNGT